jgi:hypothetical protein
MPPCQPAWELDRYAARLTEHPARPWAAYACLAASMALVGSYVGLSKLLVAVLPIFLLAWLRFGIAALAMLHWVRRTPGEAPLSRTTAGCCSGKASSATSCSRSACCTAWR